VGDVPFEHDVFRGSVIVTWSFFKLNQGWFVIKKIASLLNAPEYFCYQSFTVTWNISLQRYGVSEIWCPVGR